MERNLIWIKPFLLVCIAGFMISMFLAGQSDSKTGISQMEAALMDSGDLDEMQKSDNLTVKKIFGLNAAEYDGILFYKGSGIMDVCELLVVKLKDNDQADDVEQAIRDRLDGQIQNFTNYGTDQIDLLNSSEIKIVGNYCFYAVSQKASRLAKIFSEHL